MNAAKWVYLYAALSCVAVAVVYCILLKFLAKIIIWASIIVTGAGLVALALFLQRFKDDNYADEDDKTGKVM